MDQDVQFLTGEAQMPLSVYESPLMNAFRRFKKLAPSNDNDGYYIVEKTNTTDSHDVLLLYGRGPVFEIKNEYTDRFEGIDD